MTRCSGCGEGEGRQIAARLTNARVLIPTSAAKESEIFAAVQFYYLDLHKSLIFSFISDAVASLTEEIELFTAIVVTTFYLSQRRSEKARLPFGVDVMGETFFPSKGRKISDIKLLGDGEGARERIDSANIRNSSHSKFAATKRRSN